MLLSRLRNQAPNTDRSSLSPARLSPVRKFAGMVLLVAVLPILSACGSNGFRPLHGPTADGSDLSQSLKNIKITKIPGRVGQRIRNELIFQTTGGGDAGEPAYVLTVVFRESVSSTLVKRDGDITGQVYNLDASFTLSDIKKKKDVLSGNSFGRAGYESFISAYANVRARIDAENRAAKTVAKDIQTRIAAYMAGNV